MSELAKTFFGERLLAAATGKLSVVPRRDEKSAEVEQSAEAEIVTKAPEEFPDLDALPASSPRGEILQAVREEVERKRHWAHAAGAKLLDLEQEFAALQREQAEDPDIVELSPRFRARYAALEQGIATIGSVGEELKKHVQFAKLIEEIRRSGDNPQAVASIFARAVETGWLRVVSQEEAERYRNEWPGGTFAFAGKIYFRAERPGKPMVYPARRRFELELRQLMSRALARERQVQITTMKEQGTCQPAELLAGKKGGYYFAGANPVDHLLLEVGDQKNDFNRWVRTVTVVDALGSFSWMKTEGLRQSVPLAWVQARNVVSERRLFAQDHERALNLVRQIHRLAENGRPTGK